MATLEDIDDGVRASAPGGRSRSVGGRWPLDRRMWQVSFRVLSGALLAAYYLGHLQFTAKLCGADGVWQASAASHDTLFSPLAEAVLHLGSYGLRAWFGLGAALAVFIAVGWAPRACAALLLILGTVTYQACMPTVTLDDYMAQAGAFWLVLLLPGMATSRVRGARHLAPGSTDAAAWPEHLYLVFALAFYLDVCLESPALPPGVRMAIFAAMACAVAPIGQWRALAVVPAAVVASHLLRLQNCTLGCALSISLCGATLIGLSKARSAGPGAARSAPFALGAAIGASVVALTTLRALAMHLHVVPVVQSTGSMLSAAGLEPFPGLDAQAAGDAARDVAFQGDGQKPIEATRAAAGNPRLGIRLRLFEYESSAYAKDRSALLRNLVVQHCRDAREPDESGSGRVNLLHGDAVARSVAWFQCQGHEAEPVVIPFE